VIVLGILEITGDSVSATVNVNEAMVEFPLGSTAVQTTVWVPTVNVEPLVALEVMVTVQLSNAAGVAQVTTAEQDPVTGVIVAVTGTPAITGEIVSRTMTFTLLTTVFPEASVAVTTTGVVPTENTEPLAGLIVTVAEQLSEAVTPGITTTRLHWFPETYAVILELVIVSTGLMVSRTVTVAVAVPTLPLASVADSVTVLAPTFEQLKVDLLNEYDATAQLSVVPSFTAAVVSVAVPVAFKYKVAAFVATTGAV
jgi:hypothetical protein